MSYTADRDATLLDIDTKEASDSISKGEEGHGETADDVSVPVSV